jgi:hypothetical protein
MKAGNRAQPELSSPACSSPDHLLLSLLFCIPTGRMAAEEPSLEHVRERLLEDIALLQLQQNQ